jgi:hypothetical protein
VNAAWWAIVGVAVAGALSLAKDWLIERRRTTFAWKKDREDDLRAARIASMLIGDELETHAMNYELLARLGRTPDRPVTDTPNFLSSTEWEAHKLALARLTIIPAETWTGLTIAYHNAQQIHGTIKADGPNVAFPTKRISQLRDNELAATELSEI